MEAPAPARSLDWPDAQPDCHRLRLRIPTPGAVRSPHLERAAELIALSALLYLALHREKQFWLGLGFAAAVTLAVLIIGLAFSALTGGYLAKYMSSLATELGSGYYDGALTWLTRWLVAVSAFLGVRELVLYLVQARSESRAGA